MTKYLSETFTDQEFAILKKAQLKSRLTWRGFLLLNLCSLEDLADLPEDDKIKLFTPKGEEVKTK